jgi:RNA polymerase sigma-70 factor (ECF subfamily)
MAEECAQEAYGLAVDRWRRDGIPRAPGAWLTTVARNRAVDRLRRSKTEAAKYEEIVMGSLNPGPYDGAGPEEGPYESEPYDGSDSGIGDERLRLIFTCCHPALSLEAQVALTLWTLAGLTTVEIARAFVVPVETMAKRLVRAKNKIRNAGIPYQVPPGHLLPERTVAVLGVLYLLFNEGYSATEGADMVRQGLCAEAVRLARLLAELMTDEPEALGLLSLMLLHDARRAGRLDGAGDVVPLEEQDRALWDRDAIAEGCAVLDAALRQRRPGPYQVQAAIAACHATAATATATDWAEIASLYKRLSEMVSSPVVELNRAVAVAMAEGPNAGLWLVERLERAGTLPGYHLLPATRADLLRRSGRLDEAEAAYREALMLVGTDAERRYLLRRLGEVLAT